MKGITRIMLDGNLRVAFETSRHLRWSLEGQRGPEYDRGDWERVSRGCDVAYPFSSKHLDTIMLCSSEELVDQ